MDGFSRYLVLAFTYFPSTSPLALPLKSAFVKNGTHKAIIAGITRATASEVNWAVQAITHLPPKIKKLLIKPICPMTTALGNALRALAALKKLGTTKEVPKPAMRQPNENIPKAQY